MADVHDIQLTPFVLTWSTPILLLYTWVLDGWIDGMDGILQLNAELCQIKMWELTFCFYNLVWLNLINFS